MTESAETDTRTPREKFIHDLIIHMQSVDVGSVNHDTCERRRSEMIAAAIKSYDDAAINVKIVVRT